MSQWLASLANVFGCGPCLTKALSSPDQLEQQPLQSPPAAALERPLIAEGCSRDASCGDEAGYGLSCEGSQHELKDLYAQPSWGTNIHVMRESSPFFRVQHRGSGGGGGGIELKQASTNLLLGQYHREDAGRFLRPHPGLAVRRPNSPAAVLAQ